MAPGLLAKRLPSSRALPPDRRRRRKPRSSPTATDTWSCAARPSRPCSCSRDPFAAGAAAVVTNVSDVRARWASPARRGRHARRAGSRARRDGARRIAWAGDKPGVPRRWGTSRSGTRRRSRPRARGSRRRPLRAAAARPGDVLIAAFATDGRYMSEARLFFTALHDRAPALLRTDGEALVEVAERGCAMPPATSRCPGSPSTPQMIEGAGTGATFITGAPSRPDGTPLERWLLTFPSFGFLLAAPPEHADAAAVAVSRGAAWRAQRAGSSTTPGSCGSRRGRQEATAWNLAETPPTGPRSERTPSAGA